MSKRRLHIMTWVVGSMLAVLLVLPTQVKAGKDDSAPAAVTPDRLAEIKKHIAAEYSDLESLYKNFHSHPELAFQEEQTSARLAKELKKLGFDVATGVGLTGVVGVLKNGSGPTVMVRTDMDALPVTEATSLPYASKARVRDKEGREVGLMHACGHDMHMTCWVGTARVLSAMKDQWQGTLVLIGQPA